MSSSTSSSSDDATTPPKKKRVSPLTPPNNNLGEDELMLKSFVDLAQIKVDSGELTMRAWKRADLTALRSALIPGFCWGCVAAATSFAVLRYGPGIAMNRYLSKKKSFFHGPKGNPLYDASRRQTNPLFPRIITLRDGSTTFEEGKLIKPWTLMLDLCVSLVVGSVVFYGSTDKLKLFQAIDSIPLQAGNSPLSNALCQDFIDHSKTLPQHLWEEYNDDVILSLRRFIHNCQRRVQYEHKLRRDLYMEPDEPISIPPPGVPADLIIEDEVGKKVIRYDRGRWTDTEEFWAEADDDSDDDSEEDFWSV